MSLAGKIRALFSSGEQGWWYDPSDLSTLYQDAAGTTPVTAMEQPIGLMLDKRLGLVLEADLVTNGDFVTDTWWTKGPACTISGGSANFAGSFGYVLYRNSVSGVAVGGLYEVTFTVTNYVSGSIRPYLGTTPTFGTSVSANGTYTARFGPTVGSEIGFNSTSAFTGSIDNVSIKALAGNHRFQSTSANRPVVSARVNLLTKTEQFDAAAWTKTATTVTANSTTAPDGTTTADTLTPTVVGFSAVQSFNIAGTYTASVSVKNNGAGSCLVAMGGGAVGYLINVNLTNGAFISGRSYGGGSLVSYSISDQGNGWYRISLTVTATVGGLLVGAADGTTPTQGVFVWGADVRPTNQGVNLPAYQRVNTSTDYDSTGFPTYIKPNGSNQFMVTNSINFSSTDKMTVWQGVRDTNVSWGNILELSSTVNGSSGSFALYSYWGANWNKGFALNTGGAYGYRTIPVSPNLAKPDVISAQFSGNGNITTGVLAKIDTVDATLNSTGSIGVGNFGTYPAYFYMRAGTSLPFNGHDYGSIARGAASTAAQITAGETWINQRTKAY